jgi:ABC-type spermidine/putrescine transport system permease subunit I
MAVVPFFSLLALCVAPIAFMAYESMARWTDLQRVGWGTSEGYLRILRPDVLGPLGEITFRAGLTATLDIALAIPIADCLIRLKPSLRAVILLILTIPFVVSPTSRAFGWFQILNQAGYLNGLVHSIAPSAAPITWLLYNRGSVIITLVAATLSFSVFPIVLTLPSGTSNLWKACSDMGTSYFVRLRRITIPLGLPGIAIGWLCVFWLAFGSSVEASVVDGPTELSIGRIINGLLSAGQFAAASALGFCIAAAFGLSGGAAYILLNRVKRNQRTRIAATDNKRNLPFTSGLTKNLGPREITTTSARSRAVMRAARFIVGSLFIGLVLVYVLAPVGAVIAMSLTHVSNVSATNPTLRYYVAAFQSGPIKDAWITSLSVAIPVGISCGMLSFACGLSWLNKRWRIAVICAMAILALLPPDVYVLGLLSLARSLGSRQASLVWVAVAQTAGALPFCTAMIFAVNSVFDPFLLNVGRELGASRLRLLYSVLFRLTWQAVASAFLTAILLSLNDYTRVSYLSGSVQFLTLYVYGKMKSGTDPTVYAIGSINAIAVILLFFLALLIVRLSGDGNRTRSQR